jgi:putative nucleotidyltransferase with HDIG domain
MIDLNEWFELEDFRKYKLYIVGGSVRDILMDEAPKDIDVVCKNAKTLAIKIVKRRNAALISMEKKPDEPCYRIIRRDRPEYTLDLSEMRGESIGEDLNKRDFTINAIAIEIKEDGSLGDSIDPFEGIEDIRKRIIRVTNREAFVNDPLRILRGIRLASMLDFSIDSNTLLEMRSNATLLRNVAPERVMSELFLILKNKSSNTYFRQMDDLGMLDIIFPEIIPTKGCSQNRFHHLDVWQHSLLTMQRCEEIIENLSNFFGRHSAPIRDNLSKENRMELLKLSALLHDIGKPLTFEKNIYTGRITFHKHAEKGAELIDKISERLKLSNKNKEFLHIMVLEHLNILNLYANGKSGYELIKWIRSISDNLAPLIILSISDIMSALGPESTELKRKSYVDWTSRLISDYYEKLKSRFESKAFITGHDLLSMGISEGPIFRKILNEIRLMQDAQMIKNKEEAIKEVERLYKRLSQSLKKIP